MENPINTHPWKYLAVRLGILFAVVGCAITFGYLTEQKPQNAASDTSVNTVTAEAAPEPVKDNVSATVKIASWNVLNLGKKTRVRERAEIISQFDIVALQEVESLEGLERLRAQVETTAETQWKAVVSEKIGKGRAAEYYVFMYRADRVKEIDGSKGVYPEDSPDDFSREPFFATFRSGKFDFTLVTIHVTSPQHASEATAEVKKLADVWQHIQDLDPDENDILLMGDFNKNKPTHKAFSALEGLGLTHLITGSGSFTTYSTKPDKIGANWYDNIWMDPDYTNHEYTGQSGIDYIHERYCQESEHPHVEVRKKVSDHCPVWAVFDASKDDD